VRRTAPGSARHLAVRTHARRLRAPVPAGHAHSIEVYDDRDCLVGGLYGVALGGVFFGESMFSHVSDASKVALVALVQLWSARGGSLIDCQVENPHLNSLGARCIPRVDFERRLAHTVDESISSAPWVLPSRSGGLV
jgi:leucyl/phenylalanyl-tRNA--protein transferase